MSAAPDASWLERIADGARERARRRVAVLRAKHPEDDRKALAERLVRSLARRAGLGGAASATLSLVALPVGLPAGVAFTLATEAELLLSLLELYGHEAADEAGRVKLYALWAGGGLADAAKSVGLGTGAAALGAVLAGSLPARIIRSLNPALVRAVLGRLGLGWVPRVLRLWPVLGAPIGYVADRAAVGALGQAAIEALESAARPA